MLFYICNVIEFKFIFIDRIVPIYYFIFIFISCVANMDRSKKIPLLHMETGEHILSPEELCRKYTGTWGLWQIRTFLIVSLVKIPSAWQMASILFTAASPSDVWCLPPNDVKPSNFDMWRNYTHPKIFDMNAREEKWFPCEIFDVDPSVLVTNETDFAPENSSLLPCSAFGYDSDVTIITQWDLICERSILISVSQFFYLFGILVGGIVAFFCIQRFGPKNVLLTGIVLQILTGIGIAYAPFLELTIFLRFLVACCCCSMFTAGYVICTDIFNSVKSRTIFQCCYEHFWSIGVITLAMWTYALPNWTDLQLALSIPTVIILFFYRWIPNSPKWLLLNGKVEEARIELANAAKTNNLKPPAPHLEKYLQSSSSKKFGWLTFLKGTGLVKTCAFHITWACTIVTYYGALLNVKNLGDHVIFNTMIAGIAEIVGVLIGLILILHCKRKWFYLGLIQIFGGTLCLLCWAIPDSIETSERETIMLCLGMAGRIAIATSLTLLQVASGELIDPQFRQIGIFSAVVFARVFLLSAPFIGTLAMHGNNYSLSAFAAITILGGLSSFPLAKS